jgi:hypothetical protein
MFKIFCRVVDEYEKGKRAMVFPIKTSRDPYGHWIAKVLALPGLKVYGSSQEETLVTARKLSAMLLYEGKRRRHSILAFYPGRIPDSARIAGLS